MTSATKVTATSNHTLYAHWDTNSYSITMAVEGDGTVSPSSGAHSYSYGTQVPLTATPNAGWLFKVWQEDGSTATSRTVTVTGSATYTAVFTQEIYTVTFDANGGSVSPQSMNFTYNSTYGTLPTPAWAAHEFNGWFTAASGGNQVTASTTVTSSHTLYAHWTVNASALVFDANGGTGPVATGKIATYGSPMPTPILLPTRAGYVFWGFYDAAKGGKKYYTSEGASARNWDKDTTSPTTLYAHWTPIAYSIAFSGGDGASGEMETISGVAYGQKVVLPSNVFAKSGYTFQHWQLGTLEYADGATVSNLTTTADATVTLVACWTVKTSELAFDANGGTGTMTTGKIATYGSRMPTPVSLPTRTGYLFWGFYDAAKGGTKYYTAEGASARNWDKDTTSPTTLYAHWKPIVYSIAFSGGAGAIGEMATITGVEYGKNVTLPANAFTKPGCAFQHWKHGAFEYADGATVSNLTTTDNDTVVLAAVWDGPFWVKFGANGGSGEMDVQRFEQGEPQALSENLFARAGYGFSGWATNGAAAAALKVTYTNRQVVVDIAEVGSTNTIFAVWATNTYWVSFDANGGTGDAMAPQRFVYDQVQNLSSNTYSNGVLWRFGGWSNTVDGVVYADGASVSNLCAEANATNTLIAVWADDRTDLSRTMHCTNMQWYGAVMPPLDKGSNMWTIREGEGFGYEGSGSCVEQAGPAGNALVSSVVTNGTLAVAAADAINGIAVSFAPGTALVLKTNLADAELTRYGIRNVGLAEPFVLAAGMTTLPLTVDAADGGKLPRDQGGTVGILTVSDSATNRFDSVVTVPKTYRGFKFSAIKLHDAENGWTTYAARYEPRGCVISFK